jgi:hypothetical protein
MDNATQILIIGGMLVLSFGLILGIPMAMARGKASRAPRYLFAAHLAAIIQGGMLLALTIAVGYSELSATWETVAASFLTGGVVLFDLGLTIDWLKDIKDAFAEKSIGNKVSSVGTPFVLIGTGIILFGVITSI